MVELADIFDRHGAAYQSRHSVTIGQAKAIKDIMRCRTAYFGYHVDACTDCENEETAYNSCRNRHCPKCQGIARRKWVRARLEEILPVPYHHVVFTLPAGLFPITLYNQSLIYDLLFESASSTLLTFGRDPKWVGGEIGFYGVLHTWGQTLWSHPHVHFLVTAGGIDDEGRWVKPSDPEKFLFPVRALSKVFRGRFIEGLKAAYHDGELMIPSKVRDLECEASFERWLDGLVSTDWVVFSKPPFSGPEKVIHYIGRYTHRVAISNGRILSMENGAVRFSYRDYQDQNQEKDLTLDAFEFIRRFLWHILPKGFHKVRHFGFLANGRSKTNIPKIRDQLSARIKDNPEPTQEGLNGILCPICRKGFLIPKMVINRFGQKILRNLGAPFGHLPYAFS